MTPSERIKCISKVSAALGNEDWQMIDPTLKQFSLPWSDEWEDQDKVAYVREMINDAKDERLLALAEHLGIESELWAVVEPTFWNPDDVRIFISHTSTFKKDATAFQKAFAEFGIKTFVAHEDIEPTKEWQSEIEVALSTMDALLVLLAPGFNESNWTDQEVGFAMGRRVPIIPIRIGLNPYGFIGKYQALQGKGRKHDDVVADVLTLLLKTPAIAPKVKNALVEIVADSSSWAEAKSNMDYLERCPHLSATAVAKQLWTSTEGGSLAETGQL